MKQITNLFTIQAPVQKTLYIKTGLLFLFLITSCLKIDAQNRWEGLFSYLQVNKQQIVDNKIYAQSENAIFIYDTQNGELETISSINGLTGEKISNFYYHSGLKKLFIFHQGGMIEIMDEQQKIHRSPELAFNSFITADEKQVYDIVARQNKLYLATGYGISVYDLEQNEFNDTYYTGLSGSKEKVFAIAFQQNYIYAAAFHGLLQADLNDNLSDFNNWNKIADYTWSNLLIFNDKLIGSIDTKLYEINGNNRQLIANYSETIQSISANEYLNISFNQKAVALNSQYITQHQFNNPNIGDRFTQMIDLGNSFYIGTRQNGILKTVNGSNFENIHPDGPLYNHPFGIDYKDNKLWVVYGDHTTSYNPWPRNQYGVSTMQDKQWINIPYQDINVTDLSYVRINPSNTNEVYITSADQGLLKFENNVLVTHYDASNSPLSDTCSPSYTCARAFALDFDPDNNLWVTQQGTPQLFKLKPDNSWELTNISTVFSGNAPHGFSELVFDNEGNVWIGTEYKGVAGYNPNTGQSVSIKEGINSSYTNVTALAIDKDGTMWMGNHEGLRILTQPEKAFTQSDLKFQPIKIVYEDVVQLLMEGQNISVIKVDGSNNKWFGTQGGGVYYFNEDGTKTLHHFTQENSPLPSNEIYDISIDGTTGKVYFATANGLVVYKGNATEAEANLDDVYAFPNPVNMQKHNFVTIRGLMEDVIVKIVDVEGNLVYETVSKGGSIDWDLTAFGRYKVSSGVYIGLITNDDGTTTQTVKILIIK